MYNYWFVGGIPSQAWQDEHPFGRVGRIEVTYPDNTQGHPNQEYVVSYDWSLIKDIHVEFEDFIDFLETDNLLTLDELFGMYYDLTGVELVPLT